MKQKNGLVYFLLSFFGRHNMVMFKHDLGKKAEGKVTGLKGIIVSRSESIYGCNRYYIQPKANTDMKMPDGLWHDEEDLRIIGDGVTAKQNITGGPVSSIR